MLKRKIFSAVIVSLLGVSGAYAATPGGYAGVGLGFSSLDTPKNWLDVTPQFYSSKKGGLGGRIFGGYNINEYFGVEAGVTQYAQSSYKFSQPAVGISTVKATYNMRALDIVGKAYLPLSDTGFNLYALGGMAETYNNFKATATVIGASSSAHSSYHKLRPKFGAGVSYAIDQNISANFEISRIQGTGNFKTSNKPIANADMAAFTLAYNFG